MTDEIDVDLGDGVPIVIDVAPGTAARVDVAPPPALAVPVADAPPIAADLSLQSTADVENELIDPIDVGSAAQDPIDVIIGIVSAMSLTDQQRLYSKVFGEAPGKAPIEVWSVSEQGVDAGGDSIQWVITATPLEIARGVIIAPLWRNRGRLEIDLVGDFDNTSGVPFNSTIAIQTMPWPNSTFPEPWTTAITLLTFPMANGGAGTMRTTITLNAAGHTGGVYKQTVVSLHLVTNAPGVLPNPYDGIFYGGNTTIDTTKDLAIRITVTGSADPTKLLTITSSNANLHNYEVPSGGN